MAKKKVKKVEKVEYVTYVMKSTSTYVMSKSTKRMLALMPFRNQQERNAFKKQMIQAELAERESKNRPWAMSKKDKEDVSERT